MTLAKPPTLTLAEFLAQPETKPASEYIDGEILPKPMPKARHARLQGKLIAAINSIAEPGQIAYAFPELRCTFAGRSIVPDIAIFYWQNIELDQQAELQDNVAKAPDWTIEILSPEQSANRVTGNILHCLRHGCQLGWLIDPDDRSIIVFQPQQLPEQFSQAALLPCLPGINLGLTAADIFGWLNMRAT